MFACIAFIYSQELLSSKLGVGILFMIVLFWIIRILVLQPLFVGFKTTMSKLQVGFFLVGLILFIIPLIDALWKNFR
jgi:hypothetical protein